MRCEWDRIIKGIYIEIGIRVGLRIGWVRQQGVRLGKVYLNGKKGSVG